MIRVAGSAVALALLLLLAPSTARAGDIEEFEIARSAYEARDYERAVIYFEQLVAGERPRLESRALVAEARKYLGAAYLFVGRRDAAREQFVRLLRDEPDYLLDPLRFPVDVQELFDSVQERLGLEAREAEARAALTTRAERAEARARDLLLFAEAENPVEFPNSRWFALFPLGVGQFQNGDDGLGWAFLVTEAVLAGGALGAMVWWQDVSAFAARAQAAGSLTGVSDANSLLAIAFPLHWTAIGALAAVTMVGLIEAQVSFRASRVVLERRSVPDDLREGIENEPSIDLRVGVGPGQISASFAF